MLPAPVVHFPFEQQVLRDMDGESADGQGREEAIEALANILEWLSAPDVERLGRRRRMEVIGLRVVVLTYVLRPDLVGESISEIARRSGLQRRRVSWHFRQLFHRFGFLAPCQQTPQAVSASRRFRQCTPPA